MVKKIVVVGGGFAGCAAAASAARAGAEVTLVERTDALTGLGQLAGTYKGGGQFPAHEEIIAMGAADIPRAIESVTILSDLKMQNPPHLSLYDCRKIARMVDKVLRELGVKIIYRSTATGVKMSGREVRAIHLKNGTELEADAIVEATGGTGPVALCEQYGRGCVSCVAKCPTFGGRVSIAAKAGVKEFAGLRPDGTPGGYAAALTLCKETLSPEIQRKLEQEGELELSVPEELVEPFLQRMRLTGPSLPPEHARKLQLLYLGYANVIGMPWLKREELEKIPGLENAIFVSPYTGWIGNCVRYLAVAPRDNTLKAQGVENLFVAGEKAGGQFVGTTPAYVSGALAGHNAVRKAAGLEPLELPRTTAVGDYIAYTGEHQSEVKTRHSITRGPAFNHLNEQGLYTTDVPKIRRRVEELGLTGILSRKLV